MSVLSTVSLALWRGTGSCGEEHQREKRCACGLKKIGGARNNRLTAAYALQGFRVGLLGVQSLREPMGVAPAVLSLQNAPFTRTIHIRLVPCIMGILPGWNSLFTMAMHGPPPHQSHYYNNRWLCYCSFQSLPLDIEQLPRISRYHPTKSIRPQSDLHLDTILSSIVEHFSSSFLDHNCR